MTAPFLDEFKINTGCGEHWLLIMELELLSGRGVLFNYSNNYGILYLCPSSGDTNRLMMMMMINHNKIIIIIGIKE
jgi:hypothetical protein